MALLDVDVHTITVEHRNARSQSGENCKENRLLLQRQLRLGRGFFLAEFINDLVGLLQTYCQKYLSCFRTVKRLEKANRVQ